MDRASGILRNAILLDCVLNILEEQNVVSFLLSADDATPPPGLPSRTKDTIPRPLMYRMPTHSGRSTT